MGIYPRRTAFSGKRGAIWRPVVRLETNFPDELLDAIASRVADRLKPYLGTKTPEAEAILDVPGVARYLGVTSQRVYDAVALGEMPYFKVGRYVRFKRSKIDAWIESQSVPATSPTRFKVVR